MRVQWGRCGRRDYIKAQKRKTFRSNRYVHYFYCGGGFTDVYTCQNDGGGSRSSHCHHASCSGEVRAVAAGAAVGAAVAAVGPLCPVSLRQPLCHSHPCAWPGRTHFQARSLGNLAPRCIPGDRRHYKGGVVRTHNPGPKCRVHLCRVCLAAVPPAPCPNASPRPRVTAMGLGKSPISEEAVVSGTKGGGQRAPRQNWAQGSALLHRAGGS